MDATELLQNLFCCMFPLTVRKKKRIFKSDISVPIKRTSRVKIVLGSGDDRYQRILWLHSRANYTDLKRKILDGISYDRSRTLVVWCPQHVVSNDFVITTLHQYGEVENFIDNFSRRHSGHGMWYGTIVEYSTVDEAYTALKEIPLRCRHIKIVPLSFILTVLVDCELLHGEFDRNSSASTVIVSGRRSVKHEKSLYLFFDLSEFGKIIKLLFDYRHTTSNVVCKVMYSYFTQAYLAMMMLHGQHYDEVLLSAKLEEEDGREEIIEQAKKCVMMAMESYF